MLTEPNRPSLLQEVLFYVLFVAGLGAMIFLICLVFGPRRAYGSWGPSCAPGQAHSFAPAAQAQPAYEPAPVFAPVFEPAPAFAQPAPQPTAHQPAIALPSAPAPLGPGGCCSAQCSCGCNDGAPCACGGPAKPARVITGKPKPKPKKEPPAAEQKAEEKEEPEPQNFGIDLSRMGTKVKYSIGGKECSRAAAVRALGRPSTQGDGRIPDDSQKFRLLVVGAEPDRKRVVADAEKLPADVKAKLLVQAYPAESPLVEKLGLVRTGSPMVCLLAPSGKCLGRNLDGVYRGPEVMAAVEDKVKNYDPSKDPDLMPAPKPAPKPDPKNPNPEPAGMPWWGWLLIAAGGLLLVAQKNPEVRHDS